MIAVSRIKPAVVNSPDDRFSALREVIKEDFVVEEIAVDVVDMDDVRVYFLDGFNEALGRKARAKSVSVQKSGFKSVKNDVQFSSDGDRQVVCACSLDYRSVVSLSVPSATVCNIAIPSVRGGHLTDFSHNASGGGVRPDYRVDL